MLLYIVLAVIYASLVFAVLAWSLHSIFIFGSMWWLTITYMITNYPFLINKDIYSEDYTKNDIFKAKFILSIILWITGVVATYLVFLTAPAIANSDPEIVFYTYDIVTTFAIILLSSTPFLFLTGLLSYATYGCTYKISARITIFLMLSCALVAIPLIVDKDILITMDGNLLFGVAMVVTIICVVLFLMLMKLSKEKYLNTEYPWKDVMKQLD